MNDLISRQAAIDGLRDYLVGKRCPDDGTLTCRLIENEVINKLPPAQPEHIRGRWILAKEQRREDTENGNYMYNCSNCDCGDLHSKAVKVSYCWNCGADMRTAEQIVHDAIDNTPMAEDAYPGIKERLHKAVDDMREVTNGN